MRRLLTLLVVVAAAMPGLGSSVAAAAAAPPARESVIAHAVGAEVPVFTDPGASAPAFVLSNPTPTDGELVFLVDDIDPTGWVQVVLPVRPNGTTGWVRLSNVLLKTTTYRVIVDLSDHELVVRKGKKTVIEAPVGVGKGSTPTPGGQYYLTQLFEPPDPDGPYGPYAYALSGYSETLTSFNGGEAVIGIHGTNHPELVGTDVSSGCIRVKNDVIREIVKLLPLGTPVTIRA